MLDLECADQPICCRAAAGTSIDAYNAFVTKNGLKSEVVDLSDNTRGAWLGDKTADTIILWLHGEETLGPVLKRR